MVWLPKISTTLMAILRHPGFAFLVFTGQGFIRFTVADDFLLFLFSQSRHDAFFLLIL